ncbi:MAG: carboxymuconolactone decarboxylase family protein [Pseudomonadota bacterium]
MARIPPLAIEDIEADDIKARFEHYRNTRGFTPHSIMTMVRRPNIVRAFMALNQAVLYEGTVSEELKMLVSLIASQASGCTYCQAHMANLSSRYQASDEKIRAVWSFQTSELFSDAERAALTLAYHSALVPNEATDADFDRLKAHFDDDQIVEIVAAISLFGYLNRWNDTMATELEEHAIDVAERSISSVGWTLGKHAADA